MDDKQAHENMFKLISQEMQIKITTRYYYTHTWMGKMKTIDNIKC